MPTLFNLRGYTRPDPLDKAASLPRFLLLALINLGLSILLIDLITRYQIVTFRSFTIEVLEVIINSFVYTALILLTRKCSSIVPFLIVFLPYYILDLHIESYYRLQPGMAAKALWLYNDGSIVSGIHPAALKFLVTISVDAIVFGILSLFLARLLAAAIYAKRPYDPVMPTKSEYTGLFRPLWTLENITRPHRDAAFWILRLLGIGYAIYLGFIVIGMAGSGAWPGGMAHLIVVTYSNTALAINTFFKITLMVILAFTGAYNKTLRYYCCIGLFAGHALSATFSLIFHFGIPGATESAFLLLSGELDGAMAVIFLVILLASRSAGRTLDPERDAPVNWSIPMTLQKIVYCVAGILFLLFVAVIVYIRLHASDCCGIRAIFGYPDPLISNTITFYGTIGVLFLLQVSREQLRSFLFNPTIIPLLAGSILALAWFVIGEMRTKGIPITIRSSLPGAVPAGVPVGVPVVVPAETAHIAWYFGAEGILGIVLCLTVIGLRRWFYKADYGVNTVSPSAAFCFLAMAQAFFGGDDKQRTQMLTSVDSFMSGIRSRKRGLLNAPFGVFENLLNFIYGLHPPFSAMSRDEQRYFLHKYFLRDEWARRTAYIPPLAEIAYQIGIALNTFVSFAEFNHINPRYKIGYVPVDARDRTQGDCAAYDPPFKHIAALPKDPADPLNFKPSAIPSSKPSTQPSTPCADGPLIAPRVTTPVCEPEIPAEADYIIIGSGAGGATAAYRLACRHSHPDRILVIETGARFQPLQDFSDNEMEMFGKLYKEGGLQQTKKFTFTLAQGECVGGTTVINNAVCFQMPQAIRDKWAADFGLSLTGIDAAYQQVGAELNIQPLGQAGVNQTTRQRFVDAVRQYNTTLPPAEALQLEDPVNVNHRNNTGDGNWNIGNKRMQKRSMLETFIPWAESRGVKVVSNTTAASFVTGRDQAGQNKATHVLLRSANGKLTRVKINKALIIAAGAIASSQFLMRSNVGHPPAHFVGKNLSCNFAFPLALEFDCEILAFDGDQITIAALDPQLRSAFETYFNPPATFSITSVPFFFDRRDRMMSRYRNLVNFGSLIGSEPNGEVLKRPDLIQGRPFDWNLGDDDVSNIKYSLKTLLELGRLAGARKAILPTKPGIELDLRQPGIIDEYATAMENYPLRITDLYIGTAHPQGGNRMAAATSKEGGTAVVDENFRVRGYSNVFVADASVFPTSITVNPQWTIMALSTLAMKNVP